MTSGREDPLHWSKCGWDTQYFSS